MCESAGPGPGRAPEQITPHPPPSFSWSVRNRFVGEKTASC